MFLKNLIKAATAVVIATFLAMTGSQSASGELATRTIGTKNVPTLYATPNTGEAGFQMVPGGGLFVCKVGSREGVYCPPWQYVDKVVHYAYYAGIDTRLLMAVLYNEQCAWFCPIQHGWLPETVRSWVSGASLGVTNIKEPTFNEVKAAHSVIIGKAQWRDLAYDPDLAIKVAAFKLADIQRELPDRWDANLTRDQLLAMGLNQGAGVMLDFSRNTPPQDQAGSDARWYGDQVAKNWPEIESILCQSGAYRCFNV